MPRLGPIRYVCGSCIRGIGLIVLWLLWLVLGAGIALQARLYFTQTIVVPEFALRKLEARFLKKGVRIHFDALQVDKRGHITILGASAAPDPMPGPRAQFDRIDLEVNPWLALAGFIEPSRVRVEGGRLVLPAILSPSGGDETLLEDISLEAVPRDELWDITSLHGRTHGAHIHFSGTLPDFSRFKNRSSTPTPSGDAQRGRALLWRRVAQLLPQLDRADGILLALHLTRNEDEAGHLRVHFVGRKLLWPTSGTPLAKFASEVELLGWKAGTQIDLDQLMDGSLPLELALDGLNLGDAFRAEHLHASTTFSLAEGKGPVRWIDLSASSITAKGTRIERPTVHLAGEWPQISATLDFHFFDQNYALQARGDATQRSGNLSLTGAISPALIAGASKLTQRPLDQIIQPAYPAPFALEAAFKAGGEIDHASGWVQSGPVVVRNVALNGAQGELWYSGRELAFRRIVLQAGESEARGSYESDTGTRQYRFLLTGHLQPEAIAGWFQTWWPRFWTNFSFTTPPIADIDIQGVWGDVTKTNLFLSATAEKAEVMGAPFDHVFTSLFVKPQYFDVRFMDGRYAGHRAIGSFDRAIQANTNQLVSMRFDVESDLPVAHYETIFKNDAKTILEPFHFETPPSLHARGTIYGAASTKGVDRSLDLTFQSATKVTLFDFPVDGVQGEARVNGDKIDLPKVSAGFAGGTARGTVSLEGAEKRKKVRFEGRLEGANLGSAIVALENFGNRDKPNSAPAAMTSRFQRRIAEGNLSVAMSGAGLSDDPYSYQGSGLASVSGAKLAEINLLGQLSQALKSVPWLNFTTFALNDVESRFRLDRTQLQFDSIKVVGPSAQIAAHGWYDLKAKNMSMDATFYPFGQSRNLLGSAMDLVLTPISSALELRLEGSLDKPKWHFVLGPTGLLRRMSGQNSQKPTAEPAQDAQPSPLLRRQ